MLRLDKINLLISIVSGLKAIDFAVELLHCLKNSLITKAEA